MNVLLQIQSNIDKERKIGFAKPSLKKVQSFGKGRMAISGSTMDLMMFVSPYVDLDGRIVLEMDEIRQRLFVQHKTFYHALHQALEHRLLYKRDGFYYSNFHIGATGESGKAEYLKLLKVYTSPTLLNYSLNKKRLFYYFASVTTLGTWQRIFIENLYKNELRHKEYGVKYFSSFKEMASALITLIQDGLLEVKLHSMDGLVLDSTTERLNETFNAYFNMPEGNRKSRLTSVSSKAQVISVRVSPLLIAENEMEVVASKTELHQLAENYMLDWTELREETKNIIVGYKNKLYHAIGNTGISIYREALHTYVKEFGPTILHFDLDKNKAANFFMDFYLLPAIKAHLLAVASQPNIMNKKMRVSEILGNRKLLPVQSIEGLVEFYLTHGSLSHKVTLQQELEQRNISYRTYTIANHQWEKLHKETFELYESIPAEYAEHMNLIEWKTFVYQRAIKQHYRDKDAFIEMVMKYLTVTEEKETTVKPEKLLEPASTERIVVPFYNWLEEK